MPGKEKKATTKPATKAAAPYKKPAVEDAAAKKKRAPQKNPLFLARPKNYGIGQDVPYKRDISRFMRWPAFVTRQRKKRVLERRLKTPPALHQFSRVLDRSTRNEVLKLVKKYAPETRKQRKDRLKQAAVAKAENPKKAVTTKKPLAVVTGVQEVTRTIEKKTAKLVIIASNVDPIEIVMWMPTLCRSQKIPYAIVNDKARMGEAVGFPTVTCIAITEVRSEDEATLKNVIRAVNARFTSRADVIRRQWGGLQLSLRSRAAIRKKRARATKVDTE